MSSTQRQSLVVTIVSTLLLLMALGVVGLAPAAAQEGRPNGAGLVVRHGDGSIIYAYVEFSEDSISGEELLLRSGLDLVVAPFAGLGTAVCTIDGEGCPADDCFCESYGSPALFWHYFGWNGGAWEALLRGPTGRELRDGDVDGWSWSAGEAGLPATSIEEIAAITGFDRAPRPTATLPPAKPTATPSPTIPTATLAPTVTPIPADTETPIPLPPTATSTPAPEPTATSTQLPLPAPTATPEPSTPTLTPTEPLPTPTASPTSLSPTETVASSTIHPSPTATEESEQSSATSPPSATATPGSGAVIVRPGAPPEPLETPVSESEDGQRSLLTFGGFAVLIALSGITMLIIRRRGRSAG